MSEKRYYLEPRNDHTREQLIRYFAEKEIAGVTVVNRKAEHGKYPPTIECDADDRDYFLDSKTHLHLDFHVWEKKRDGVLKRWYPKSARRKDLRLVPV